MHNKALKQYVEQTWGWDEDWQRNNFAENFNPREGEIIVVDGEDSGFLWVIEKNDTTLLASIRLLPAFQHKGIGTKIIRDVLNKSIRKNKPVILQVLKVNPARSLYERLGFKISDETETHLMMKAEASKK